MKKLLALLLALIMALSLCACGGGKTDNNASKNENNEQSTTNVGLQSPVDTGVEKEETVPNNGEWDEILCSGDDYYLVKKEIDAYDGYKFMLGVVNSDGESVQELTDTGKFVEAVRFRAEGSSKTLRDSSCYTYLGEGVFLASPGVSVYTEDKEYRIGPWHNTVSYTPTGNAKVSIWECLTWNVVDNIQKEFGASKISTFQDGYLFYLSEDEYGGGMLTAMNTKGEITELPCKLAYNFPVYREGLFYAMSEKYKRGFFDIEGNLVIDLSKYDMKNIPYPSVMSINAPYFENGQATILFENNAGSVFKAIIDKTGAFVGEPEKIQ